MTGGATYSAGAGEGGVVEAGHVNLGHVDGGGGGDSVHLVHAAQRHAVDLEGAGHQQEARLELLEEHHALALEAASEDDEHGAGHDAGLELGALVVALAGRQRLLDVVGGVEARLLL